MRFLIDECLTTDLVFVAHEAGHEAQHVAHVGKAGLVITGGKGDQGLRKTIAYLRKKVLAKIGKVNSAIGEAA